MIKTDIISFSNLDTSSRFVEKINKNEFFVRWGLDNMEIERWYDYADFSPIHAACLLSKLDNCVGRGFTTDYKINTKQTLNDVSRQMFWEFLVGGNLFLEILWKNDRKEGIAGFHVIPSKFMRAGKPNEDDINARTERLPMDAKQRKAFLKRFAPGILFSVLIYEKIHIQNIVIYFAFSSVYIAS